MNKGKVRIYELSKELDLENKDILAICDQLEIAVKSHSSTISEEDASRIIAVAKANGYKPTSKAIKPQPTRSSSASPPGAKPSIVQKPVRPREQQILEIRRYPRPAAPPEPTRSPATDPPATANAENADVAAVKPSLPSPPSGSAVGSSPTVSSPSPALAGPPSRPAAAVSSPSSTQPSAQPPGSSENEISRGQLDPLDQSDRDANQQHHQWVEPRVSQQRAAQSGKTCSRAYPASLAARTGAHCHNLRGNSSRTAKA